MALRRERNRNTNTAATLSDAITLNATTAVKIADVNKNRIFFSVSLAPGLTTRNVFIKLQAASVGDNQKGIILYRDFTANDNAFLPTWGMPTDNIYTGEISAITQSGAQDVYVTEY